MRTDHREGIGAKARKIIYSKGGSARTRMVDTSGRNGNRLSWTTPKSSSWAAWPALVEVHYGRPMDMEWAKDGLTDELLKVQAHPETVQSRKSVGRPHAGGPNRTSDRLLSRIPIGSPKHNSNPTCAGFAALIFG